MASFRILAFFFSGIIMLIATVLVPVAYFGDKNPIWTRRLLMIDAVAAVVFAVCLFWW